MKALSFITTLYNIKKSSVDDLFDSFGNLINSEELEFIIIDDNSDKFNTFEYLKDKYKTNDNFLFFKMNEHTKRTKAFIKGISLANGKYIHSLDSDALVNASSLSIVIDILRFIDYDFILNSFFLKDSYANSVKEDGMYSGEPKTSLMVNAIFSRRLTFGAYNTIVKTEIAKNTDYSNVEAIFASHDDVYFSQKWLKKSNSTFFLDEPFFIYTVAQPCITFPETKSIINTEKNENHWVLANSIINDYDKDNELTIINVISILTSHFESLKDRNPFYKIIWALKLTFCLDRSIKKNNAFRRSLFNRKYLRGYKFWK